MIDSTPRPSIRLGHVCDVGNLTSEIQNEWHNSSHEFGGPAMTHQTQDNQDSSFPYVLVYGTVSTVIALASVWISTALSFGPAVGVA